jgi:hypothetical protein
LELKGPKYPPNDQLLTYSPTVDDLNKRSLLKLAGTPLSEVRSGISHQISGREIKSLIRFQDQSKISVFTADENENEAKSGGFEIIQQNERKRFEGMNENERRKM